MMDFIRKNIFCGFFVFVVIVFMTGYIYLNYSINQNISNIEKISGDESLLKDIEISGIIHDQFSAISFKLKDKELQQNLIYYNNYLDYTKILRSDRIMLPNYYFFYDYPNGLLKLVYNNGNKEKTGIIKAQVNCQKTSTTYRTKFMGELNGKIYFIIPTDDSCRGISGIYEVFDFDKLPNNEEEANKEIGYRKISDIDLKDGKVEVNGMFVVGNSLCVIFIENGKLKVQAFNIINEEFSEAIEIPLKYLASFENEHVGGYVNSNYLNLVIDQVYTLEITNEISLVKAFDIGDELYGEEWESARHLYSMPLLYNAYRSIGDLVYKNDKLYIVNYIDTSNNENNNPLDVGEKYLEVLMFNKQDNILFSGKINTSLSDDRIWVLGFKENEQKWNDFIYKNKYSEEANSVNRSFGKIEIEVK